MTEVKLQALVTEAVELDREIAEKTERLKELKHALVTEAESREDEHLATDGGGRAWSAAAMDGCFARVNFPAPSLKSKIDGEGKAIERIRTAAGKVFDRLFRPAVNYKPIDGFREEAQALLGGGAGKLIRLCESESAPRVSFETKDKEAA